MSGIAAIFERSVADRFEHARLPAMAASLADIGPDGSVTLELGPVGLVHTHHGGLTPEDRHEQQPVRAMGGRLAVLFDGRIDNRQELGARVGIPNSEMDQTSDSALFASLWEQCGAAGPDHVVGPFAAIVWDESTRELVAVRDPLGGRVLHYHESPDRVIVASAPRAIHAAGVRRQIDEVKLADSLILNYRDGARSFFVGISRLPMGHRLHVTPDRSRLEQFRDVFQVEPLRLRSDDDYVEAARDVLDRATRAVLRATVPPSLALSSGLDSTMVAAAALPVLREQGEVLHAYTSVPVENWKPRANARRVGDESPGVDAFLAMHPGIEHQYVQAEGLGLFDNLDVIIHGADAPPRNAMNLFWIHEIHRLTLERGAKVVVTGGAGNATLGFSGHGLAIELLRERRLRDLWRELRSTEATRVPVLQPLFTDVVLPLVPRRAWETYRRLRGDRLEGWLRFSALRPQSSIAAVADRRARELGFDPEFRPPATRSGSVQAMLGNAFLEGGDIMQGFRAVHGTETRDPTLDRRVVEFAMSVPTDQYRRNGQGRWLQRRLLEGAAPPEVLDSGRGRQAADGRLRLGGDLDRIRRDLDDFADDTELAGLLSIDRLREAIADERVWLTDQDPEGDVQDEIAMTVLALSRGIATGRFMQSVRVPERTRIPVIERTEVREAVAVRTRSTKEAER